MSVGHENAVIGVGSSSAHWEARRTQSFIDRKSFFKNSNYFKNDNNNNNKHKFNFCREFEQLQQKRDYTDKERVWYYKDAPKILSEKWISRTSYTRFPVDDNTKYVHYAKLPRRFNSIDYLQRW